MRLYKLIILTALTFTVKAEQDLFSMTFEQLLNVSIEVVSKRQEPLSKSPGVVSILNKEDIQAYGAKNLHDILRFIPGLQPIHPQLHHHNAVAVRGQIAGGNDKFFLLLINGKAIRDPILYGVNASVYTNFPISSIEQIEVIRGPGSVVYGSNAFAGVVNIKTKPSGHKTELSASWQEGSFGTSVQELMFSHPFDSGANLSLSARQHQRDGWELAFIDTSGEADQFKNKTDGWGVMVELDYEAWELQWFASELSERATLSSGKIKDVTTRPSDRSFLSLSYNGKWRDDWLYRLWYSSSDSSVASSTEVDAKDENFELSITRNYSWGDVDLGASSRRNKVERGIYSDHANVEYNSIYGQINYHLSGAYVLTAGANLLKPFSGDVLWSPRLALLGKWSQFSGFKLIYSNAYNSPTALEKNLHIPGLFLGNEDLKPTTIEQWDAQWYYSDASQSYSISLFHTKHDQLIDLVNLTESSPLPKIYQNVASAEVSGFEIEAQKKISNKWYLEGNYSEQHPDEDNELSNQGVLSTSMFKVGLRYEPSEELFFGTHGVWYEAPNNRPNQIDHSNPETSDHFIATLQVSYLFGKVWQDVKHVRLNVFIDNSLHDSAIFLPDPVLSNLNTMPKIAERAIYMGLSAHF